MTALLVFSPHLDDAVLSMGNVLAGAPNAAVVTMLAGVPKDGGQLRPFDERSGFRSADQAIRNRRNEDTEALRVLGARAVHLSYCDGQYEQPPTRADLVRSMRRAVRETRARIVAGPLGVMHPDHWAVADAYREVVDGLSTDVQCWLYEDLPGRVLDPIDTELRRRSWDEDRLLLGVPFAPPDGDEAKVLALRKYRSQMWALDPIWHPCMCPERLWQVIR